MSLNLPAGIGEMRFNLHPFINPYPVNGCAFLSATERECALISTLLLISTLQQFQFKLPFSFLHLFIFSFVLLLFSIFFLLLFNRSAHSAGPLLMKNVFRSKMTLFACKLKNLLSSRTRRGIKKRPLSESAFDTFFVFSRHLMRNVFLSKRHCLHAN